jgi:O-antigen ligase/tetratricopeptide (TPR) repeat protein
MLSTTYKLIKISRLLLYAIPILPIVLWAGFTFPYVTIRTVAFRVIVEIVVVLVVLLWAKGKLNFASLRQQYFFWIFLGLIVIESIAAIFGESPVASFFGDLERMWGIITVFHVFLFYILVRLYFRAKEYRTFFHVSFVTSILVSVYGIIQRNPDFFNIYLFGSGVGTRIVSTLGNPVYVAMYLLFNMAFALYLLLGTERGKLWYFYLFVIVIDFYAFTLTDIRGAYLGLMAGAASAAFLYMFLGSRRKIKQNIGAGFALAAIILILGFGFRSSNFVRQVPVLRRVVSISINDGTAQTRFIGWNAAIQGFKKDPLTGVGMENYNILFNKYFPANYYLLAPTETYFDRAHNQFFNILAESGIVALLLYLGFLLLLGWYLVRGYRNGKFKLNEFLLFSGISIAYFVHLFFVFDDLHSLLFFAVLLGFIEYTYYEGSSNETSLNHETARPKKIAPIIAMVVLVPLVLYSIIGLNFNVIRASKSSGTASLTEDIPIALAQYHKALGVNLIPSENITLTFVDYLIALVAGKKFEEVKNNSNLRASVIVAFNEAKQALTREIEKKPNDAVFYLKLGQLNNGQFLIDGDISHLFEAIGQLEKARQLSPERIQIYLILGETYVLAGESEKAAEILEQAVALEPDFKGTYYFLGRALLTNNELERAYDAIVNKGFIERKHRPEDNTIAFVLAEELALTGEFEKMVITYEHLARFEPKDARVHSALAAAYVLADRPIDAINAAQKAAEIDSSFADQAAVFIRAIEEGRIDELKESVF